MFSLFAFVARRFSRVHLFNNNKNPNRIWLNFRNFTNWRNICKKNHKPTLEKTHKNEFKKISARWKETLLRIDVDYWLFSLSFTNTAVSHRKTHIFKRQKVLLFLLLWCGELAWYERIRYGQNKGELPWKRVETKQYIKKHRRGFSGFLETP